MNKIKLTVGIAAGAMGMVASAGQKFTREELVYLPADIEVTPDKLPDVNGKPFKGIDFCLTPIFNLMNNYPIVSVPVAFSRRNVPIGVQVIGNTFDDLTSMRVAAAMSKVVKPNFREGRFPDFRNMK